MWDFQQGELRQQEMLRQAENHRLMLQMSPKPSHNYLTIARSHLTRTLIVVGQSLVRRSDVSHEGALRHHRT